MNTEQLVQNFFNEWGTAISVCSNVAMAVSAVVAVVHFKKHWRDDEPRASMRTDQVSFKTESDGTKCLTLKVTVSNDGKVPFHIGKIVVSDDAAAMLFQFTEVADFDVILDQGTTVSKRAFIYTKDDKIAFPKEMVLSLLNKAEKVMLTTRVKVNDDGAAREA